MKKTATLSFVFALLFAGINFTSCKNKDSKSSGTNTVDTTVDTTVVPTAPVVATEDALKRGVTDALKDFPSVKGEVADSVIVLTGEIRRPDWQRLMPTLNSLHPKRVNSTNVTIK